MPKIGNTKVTMKPARDTYPAETEVYARSSQWARDDHEFFVIGKHEAISVHESDIHFDHGFERKDHSPEFLHSTLFKKALDEGEVFSRVRSHLKVREFAWLLTNVYSLFSLLQNAASFPNPS